MACVVSSGLLKTVVSGAEMTLRLCFILLGGVLSKTLVNKVVQARKKQKSRYIFFNDI